MIEGAIHAPRGMLEFYADPNSPSHRDGFDPTRRRHPLLRFRRPRRSGCVATVICTGG
jgi:hypothetical protein